MLALISSGMTPTRKDLLDFFSKTFYAFQYKDLSELNIIIGKVITMLKEFRFVASESEPANTLQNGFQSAANMMHGNSEELKPTHMGKRVSELYLDPLTAHKLINGLKEANEKNCLETFNLLQMISNTMEMGMRMSLRKRDHSMVNEIILKQGNRILGRIPNEWNIDYDDFMKSIKTALVFKEWAEELGEDKILETFGVTPGELRAKLSNSDWLLYATGEIALLLGYMNILKNIKNISTFKSYLYHVFKLC